MFWLMISITPSSASWLEVRMWEGADSFAIWYSYSGVSWLISVTVLGKIYILLICSATVPLSNAM